jgi:hypothetical protein
MFVSSASGLKGPLVEPLFVGGVGEGSRGRRRGGALAGAGGRGWETGGGRGMEDDEDERGGMLIFAKARKSGVLGKFHGAFPQPPGSGGGLAPASGGEPR